MLDRQEKRLNRNHFHIIEIKKKVYGVKNVNGVDCTRPLQQNIFDHTLLRVLVHCMQNTREHDI